MKETTNDHIPIQVTPYIFHYLEASYDEGDHKCSHPYPGHSLFHYLELASHDEGDHKCPYPYPGPFLFHYLEASHYEGDHKCPHPYPGPPGQELNTVRVGKREQCLKMITCYTLFSSPSNLYMI